MRICGKCGLPYENHCNPCNREYMRQWRINNPEKAKERAKKSADKRKEQIKEYHAQYYQENKEHLSAKNKEWAQNNKEKSNGYYKKYREKNIDKCRERVKNCYKKNPDKKRLNTINRRRKLKTSGKLSNGIVKKLFELQRGKCACCGKDLGNNFHVDHIIPIYLGGENVDSNVQLLTRECNLSKNKKHPIDYMQSKGYLL